MDRIIFLDIDGVLNSQKTFKDNYYIKASMNKVLNSNRNNMSLLEYYEEYLKILLLEIDKEKLEILKIIINKTNAKIVITSSWRRIKFYSLLEEYLIEVGLPIIGCTNILNDRGEEIRDYINKYNIKNYIIIDDDVFLDFDEEQKYNLILTDFYNGGLVYDMIDDSIKKLVYKS